MLTVDLLRGDGKLVALAVEVTTGGAAVKKSRSASRSELFEGKAPTTTEAEGRATGE